MKHYIGLSLALLLIFTGCKRVEDPETLPSVTTTAAAEVTINSVVLGGAVTDVGNPPYSERGVCYSNAPNPTTSNTKIPVSGSGTTTFHTSVSGLTPGTAYYYRAYATNKQGTAYGNEMQFTAATPDPLELPVLSTLEAEEITTSAALLGGNISFVGNPPYSERGICYATTPEPTIADVKVPVSGSGTGDFQIQVRDLTPGATYYFCAYAVNTEGTAYGSELSFATRPLDPNAKYIPDPAFRAWLQEEGYITILDNTVGAVEITPAGLSAIEMTPFGSITSFTGIKYFTNLKVLYAYNSGKSITKLELEEMSGLTALACPLGITELDLSLVPNLTYLSYEGDLLTSLDLTHASNMTQLYYRGKNFTSIDLSCTPNLRLLDIRDTKITSVDLSKVPYLWNFAFSGSLTSLDLSMLPYLWGLYGMNVTITELDISHNTDLIQLYFEGNSLLTKLYVWWEGGRSNIPVQFTDFKVDNSVQLIGKNVAPDPVLSLLPAGVDPDSRIVECTVTPEQFRSLFTDAGFYAELRSITAQVYKMFRDDYDFIVYLPDVSETNRPSSDLRFAGINYTLSNSVQGLGRSLSSESAQWGSAGKLQSVIYLTGGYNAIGQGPILHELTHRWANSCCPTYGYNGDNYDTHWGISNAGGLLGGFKYIRTVEQNSGGVAGKTLYQASISSDKNPDGSFVRGFELGGYPNNSLPFSDIELYLMGMKSAQDLRNNNFRLDTYTGNSYDGNIVGQGYFWSTGLTSYTIDDLIVRNGQRVPDAANAQKSFRILTVLISQEGQSVHHYTEVVNDVKWLTGPAGSSIGTYQGLYNFREATGGAGTLVSDGIKNSLK